MDKKFKVMIEVELHVWSTSEHAARAKATGSIARSDSSHTNLVNSEIKSTELLEQVGNDASS